MLKIRNINVDEFIGYEYEGHTYFSDGSVLKIEKSYFDKSNKSYKTTCSDDRIIISREIIRPSVDKIENTLTFEKVVREEFYYDKNLKKIIHNDNSKLIKRFTNKESRFAYEYRRNLSSDGNLRMEIFKFITEVLKEEGYYDKLCKKLKIEDLDTFIYSIMKIYLSESKSVLEFLLDNNLDYSLNELLNDTELVMETYDIQPSQKKRLYKIIKTLKGLNYDISLQNIIPIVNSFNGNELDHLCKFIEVHNIVHWKLTDYSYFKESKSKDLIAILQYMNSINKYNVDYLEFLNYYTKMLFKESWIEIETTGVKFTKPLSLYLDYLRVYESCEEYNLFLDDYNLYPTALKASHDMLSQILNDYHEEQALRLKEIHAERELAMNERFVDAVNKYSYLEVLDKDDYLLKLPKDVDDLRREGFELKHCVAGYKYSIINGHSKILFLRKKSNENKAFATIEVVKNRVAQVRGYDNKDIEESALIFIEKWANKNNLDTNTINQY